MATYTKGGSTDEWIFPGSLNVTGTLTAAGTQSLVLDATEEAFDIDAGTTDHTGANIIDVNLDVNSASCKAINMDIDVGTALSTGEKVYGTYVDIDGAAGDHAESEFAAFYATSANTSASTHNSGVQLAGTFDTGMLLGAVTTKGIDITGASTTGIDMSGAIATGINVAGSAMTYGISIGLSGKTYTGGILLGTGGGTITTGISMLGTQTTGINFGGTAVGTGIAFSSACTTGIGMSGAVVTGLDIAGSAMTTGVSIGLTGVTYTTGIAAGVTGGTLTTGIKMAGTFVTAVALGSSGTPLSCAAYTDSAIKVYTTHASTDAGNSVNSSVFNTVMTGVGGVGGRVLIRMQSAIALGGWANALKAQVDWTTAGKVTGLGSVINAEMVMPSTGVSGGTYTFYECEAVCPAGWTNSSEVSLMYLNVTDATAANFDTVGTIFDLNGLTAAEGKIFHNTAPAATNASLRITVNGTPYYILLTNDQTA